jgi:LmbE family N-acetylglucosaminyl deacetylase
MPGTPPRHRTRFVDANTGEVAALLTAFIDDMHPHVVVTYDPNGGYGHPDHMGTHEVTTAARGFVIDPTLVHIPRDKSLAERCGLCAWEWSAG